MVRAEKSSALIPWLVVLGLWAVMHGAMAATFASSVFDGLLLGPDEYMRLVRIAELRDGGGWYDSLIERSNAPYGDTLHWTRPLDVLILLGATILSVFMSAEDALFASGVVISPLLGLLTCLAVAWAVFPILGRDRSIFAALIVLIQPGVLAYTALGRSDHHGLLFLLFAVAVGGAIRIIGPQPTTRSSVIAGAAYGLSVWASVEMTILVALCQAGAAAAWLRHAEIKARPQVIAAVAFFATTLMALVAERPPGALLAVEFDRLSVPYLVIAALTVAVWCAAWALERYSSDAAAPRQRLLAIGTAAAIGGGILLALFPDFIAGPYTAIDPRVVRIWHKHIAELQPLAPTDLHHTGKFLFFVGAVAISLPYAALFCWRNRNRALGMRWLLLTAVMGVYFLLSLQHFRLAPFAEIASAPVLADMIARLAEWSERRLGRVRQLLVTCATAFVLMFGSVIAGSYLLSLEAAASPGAAEPKCRISRISPLLNDPASLGARPLAIGALLDLGPEILYRTRHSVVGVPYHRNGVGNWESYRLFAAPQEGESRAIVTRRHIDLLMICPRDTERRFFTRETGSDNLYTRLLAGQVPDWLAPVPVKPESADGFRLYRVIR